MQNAAFYLRGVAIAKRLEPVFKRKISVVWVVEERHVSLEIWLTTDQWGSERARYDFYDLDLDDEVARQAAESFAQSILAWQART